MSKTIHDKMHMLKTVFLILLALDLADLIFSSISFFSLFSVLADYGMLMVIIAGAIIAMMTVVTLFEILAKVFLIRSITPACSCTPDRNGYAAMAKLLVVFNVGAVIVDLLSAGGEGATLINQARLYLHILASAVEVIAAIFYLRTRKKILQSNIEGDGN